MTHYKNAIGVRGDYLYCPLAFYIDSYWTCEPNCAYCYSRRLNRTWGNDFRSADPESIKKRLSSKKGTSSISKAIRLKKTIRLGNRSDPFQPWERKYLISTKILEILQKKEWEVVIQTKFISNAIDLAGQFLGKNTLMMAVIPPGFMDDWNLFEYRKTESPASRLEKLGLLLKEGFRVGVNGEPFIPGHHTTAQFRTMLKLLKSYGIKRYNTYNLHLNDWVAKSMFDAGVDIEKIWRMNQDRNWKKIQMKLIQIAEEEEIILGCPDFVNTGPDYKERANTCCGIDVNNPCTFNTHYFKMEAQKGKTAEEIIKNTWEGIGDRERGEAVVKGTTSEFYTLKDAGIFC